jgi:4-hydroxybenzoate polyprenyltransferase
MRPYQWTKNLLVFAGLVFAVRLFHLPSVLLAAAGFAAFCAASSACYLLNDVIDAAADRAHPLKCRRPVASGELTARLALVAAALLAAGAAGLSLALGLLFAAVVGSYLVLQIAYSTFLKHEVILDVLCIAASFLLRAYAGCVVIDVKITHWLLICAGLLALFLALAKRRHELLQVDNAASHRRSLAEYSPQMLDQMIAVVTASTLVAYILYTVWPETVAKFGTDKLLLTVPFVLYGLFRYLYLVYSKEEGGCPSRHLLTDKPLLIDIVLYAAAAVWIITCWKGR